MLVNLLNLPPGVGAVSYRQTRDLDDSSSEATVSDRDQRSEPSLLNNRIFWAILFCAFLLRLYLAMTTTYIFDEERDWIPGSLAISFSADSLNLPLRMNFHSVLAAYLIKIGPVFLGENLLGFRIAGILFGLGTIVVVALLTKVWAGTTAALWASALLAFNEYHVMFSMLAIQKTFFLFFSAAAAYTFVLALDRDRPQWLYATAALTGLAFLCYEIAALLVPVYGITALVSRHRVWLLRPHPYLAGIVLLIVISPDLISNFLYDTNPDQTYSYDDHFSRVGGVGFIKHYFLFYFMEIAVYVYGYLGTYLYGADTEYAALNAILGVMLFTSVVFWTLIFLFNRPMQKDGSLLFNLVLFWFILLFFSFIKPGNDPNMVTSHLWIWVDVTLIPAVILTGVLLACLTAHIRRAAIVVVCAGMVYATVDAVYTRFDLPSHAIAFSPETIDPADGEMADVQAHINYCYLCDESADFSLQDVGIVVGVQENGSVSLRSAFEGDDVEGAERGTRDTRFRLRAKVDTDSQLWLGRAYEAHYRILDYDGEPRILIGSVRVSRDSSQFRDPVFWAHD